MTATRTAGATAIALALATGCTSEESRGPVKWTATAPAAAVGQSDAQAWSRATSSDEPEPGSARRPTPTRAVTGQVELPSMATPIAAHGDDRVYETSLPYLDALGFFERALARDGFSAPRRVTTRTTTMWTVRRVDGERIHVAVRNTSPTTIEVVGPAGSEDLAPTGVTNAQPASPPTP